MEAVDIDGTEDTQQGAEEEVVVRVANTETVQMYLTVACLVMFGVSNFYAYRLRCPWSPVSFFLRKSSTWSLFRVNGK